jgi:hypothetical protein
VAEYAVAKGHADAEAQMANVVQTAALAGDAKMALEYLKHRADWTAAQKVEITGSQAISITVALEQAQKRLQTVDEVEDVPDPTQRLESRSEASLAALPSMADHATVEVHAR